MKLDEEIYNEYLNGRVEAFETLYLKYKDKIRYFIFNMINDYEKAEDIMQDTFIYVMNNKYSEEQGYFKYYIYMIAKTKALSYLNTENRRQSITEKYLEKPINNTENDVLEFIIEEETKKEIIESISLINEKYRNVMYLVKIEEFSYQEVANILNISIQDVKNYVYRGKKELRKILIKKGYSNMSKNLKLFISIICIGILITGGVYAAIKIYDGFNGKANLISTFTSEVKDTDINNIWVGSFQIAWNEFMNERVGRKVEFVGEESLLVNELNKQLFKKDMLSNEDYYIMIGETSDKLKRQILTDINDKFKINMTSAINNINFNDVTNNSYTIYSMLYKNFSFLTPFDRLYDMKFNGSVENVKYFGIEYGSSNRLKENVEVLFYNDISDFAVKLKTKENEEIILYLNNSNLSFNDLYNEINKKTKSYNGNKNLLEDESLRIPYIYVNTTINYSELCNKEIKFTNGMYISNAVQNVIFSLNEIGGNLISEGVIKDQAQGISESIRHFVYTKPFVIFLKETDKELPYFALKVDNTDILVQGN